MDTNAVIDTIQRGSAITFPMLGGLTIDPPSSFEIFGKTIYFYGVLIALGFILGILYISHNSRRFGLNSDIVYDIILWIIPASIIGARAYFVLFRLDDYISRPLDMIKIWEGGLAIYGGVIAGALVAFLFCKKRKIPVAAMIDALIGGLLIGQIIGRWGNFMNREAFGAPTEVFCRMGLIAKDGTTIFVHPTFLYESLWNLVLFIFLDIFVRKGKRKYDGQVALIYFFWYGIGRAWIEGLRTDSLYIGSTGIRVSQVLSAALALAALIIMIIQAKKPHDPAKLYANRKSEAEEASEDDTKSGSAAEAPSVPAAEEKNNTEEEK